MANAAQTIQTIRGSYSSDSKYSIDRGSYGYDHGLTWGIWADGQLVDTARTLKAAKRIAASYAGKSLSWERA